MTYPLTQREAYESIKTELPDKREEVRQVIHRSMYGLTLFEICQQLHWPINSVSGRVTELHKEGWIRDSGRRRVNPATDKSAIVWEKSEPDGRQLNLL
jgi:predicted Rossmann fold nucleotide-binding protein DprA/Smf involved in DNA uptake